MQKLCGSKYFEPKFNSASDGIPCVIIIILSGSLALDRLMCAVMSGHVRKWRGGAFDDCEFVGSCSAHMLI